MAASTNTAKRSWVANMRHKFNKTARMPPVSIELVSDITPIATEISRALHADLPALKNALLNA
jgi:uncharacterized protein (DUF2461 family)